jgi:hypothetical protein
MWASGPEPTTFFAPADVCFWPLAVCAVNGVTLVILGGANSASERTNDTADDPSNNCTNRPADYLGDWARGTTLLCSFLCTTDDTLGT